MILQPVTLVNLEIVLSDAGFNCASEILYAVTVSVDMSFVPGSFCKGSWNNSDDAGVSATCDSNNVCTAILSLPAGDPCINF